MTFTKKTYEMIAEIMAEQIGYRQRLGEVECEMALVTLVHSFSNRFENDNDNFDSKRFFQACGVNQ